MTDQKLTPTAAAAILGVTTATLRRWTADGKLDCYRTQGGHRRFLRSDVMRALNHPHKIEHIEQDEHLRN